MNADALESFRPFLAMLVRTHLDPRLRPRVDESGLVQQTLVEAWRQMPALNPADRPAWLRRVMLNNLADELRRLRTGMRDWRKERVLEAAADVTSARLDKQLAAAHTSPSNKAENAEDELRLLAALAELPETQREALVLQHWQGWSVAAIADHMGKSPAAVAGLIKRGLRQLRSALGSNP
jgi:RNA polymerase sigma-70 factor (ECF subfamily)